MMERAAAWRPLRSPVTYFGGKGRMAQHIVALLPAHEMYLEPFAGGLSVLFAKAPARVETVNDRYGNVCNFYRVLRDPAQFAEFQRLVALTPYARGAFEEGREALGTETDPVRRAWAWFVTARQSFGGGGRDGRDTGWSYSTNARSPGLGTTWGYSVTNSCGTRISAAVTRWLSAVENLPAVHERLRGVQIEQGDWRRVFEVYAVPGCVVYLDPPYVPDTRTGHMGYTHDMTKEDHHELVTTLIASSALCILSGYRDEDVHGPLEAAGWERVDIDVPLNVARNKTSVRRLESIWRSPACVAAWEATQARSQPSLFSSEEVPQ